MHRKHVQEILTCRPPFDHLENDLQVILAISNGQLPSQPASLNGKDEQRLWSISQLCCDESPFRRPDIAWIKKNLSVAM